MTNDATADEHPADHEAHLHPTVSWDTDWLLDQFVTMANTSEEFRITITVNHSGLLIVGDLVGGAAWSRAVEDRLRGASGVEGMAVFREELSKAEDDPQLGPLRFLHLLDARVIQGGGYSYKAGPWRGRLTEVSGWAFGKPS